MALLEQRHQQQPLRYGDVICIREAPTSNRSGCQGYMFSELVSRSVLTSVI